MTDGLHSRFSFRYRTSIARYPILLRYMPLQILKGKTKLQYSHHARLFHHLPSLCLLYLPLLTAQKRRTALLYPIPPPRLIFTHLFSPRSAAARRPLPRRGPTSRARFVPPINPKACSGLPFPRREVRGEFILVAEMTSFWLGCPGLPRGEGWGASLQQLCCPHLPAPCQESW